MLRRAAATLLFSHQQPAQLQQHQQHYQALQPAALAVLLPISCCWAAAERRLLAHAAAGSGSSSDPAASSSEQSEPPQPPQPPQQPDLVEALLSAANMSRRQQLLQRKAGMIADFQRAPGDVGSPEVQVALLTEKIRDMAAHFSTHRKDFHSMRGLQGMLNQRRKLLSFLRRSNFPRYAFVLHKLGLKDTYAKQERYDKYRVGSRLGAPAEALKRYGNK